MRADIIRSEWICFSNNPISLGLKKGNQAAAWWWVWGEGVCELTVEAASTLGKCYCVFYPLGTNSEICWTIWADGCSWSISFTLLWKRQKLKYTKIWSVITWNEELSKKVIKQWSLSCGAVFAYYLFFFAIHCFWNSSCCDAVVVGASQLKMTSNQSAFNLSAASSPRSTCC